MTQAQYEKVVGRIPNAFQSNDRVYKEDRDKVNGLDTAQFPVEMVSWDDADAFCKKLGNKVAWGTVTLPSEAAWNTLAVPEPRRHFISGARTTGIRPIAEAIYLTARIRKDRIWTNLMRASYMPNAFGLYQMHGNVRRGSDYYGLCEGLPERDPVQLDNTRDKRHVTRVAAGRTPQCWARGFPNGG